MALEVKYDDVLSECANGHIEKAKNMAENNLPLIQRVFEWACFHGNLEYAQNVWKNYPEINVHDRNEWAFGQACANGHLRLAKWFLEKFPETNVHAYEDYAFRWACASGKLETVQWFLEKFPKTDVHGNQEWAFRQACAGGYLELVIWFLEKYPETDVHSENDWVVHVCQENKKKKMLDWFFSKYPESKKLLEIKAWFERQQDPEIVHILKSVSFEEMLKMVDVKEDQFMAELEKRLTPERKRRLDQYREWLKKQKK